MSVLDELMEAHRPQPFRVKVGTFSFVFAPPEGLSAAERMRRTVEDAAKLGPLNFPEFRESAPAVFQSVEALALCCTGVERADGSSEPAPTRGEWLKLAETNRAAFSYIAGQFAEATQTEQSAFLESALVSAKND